MLDGEVSGEVWQEVRRLTSGLKWERRWERRCRLFLGEEGVNWRGDLAGGSAVTRRVEVGDAM